MSPSKGHERMSSLSSTSILERGPQTSSCLQNVLPNPCLLPHPLRLSPFSGLHTLR